MARSLVLRVAVLVASVIPAAAALGAACSPPSSEVDAGDLFGAFDRDAGPDAQVDGGARRRGKRDAGPADGGGPEGGPSAAASLDASAGVREPVQGSCAAEEGSPNRDLRRTLGRPPCRGAQVMEWRDAEGSPRYACVITPPGVEARAPLPLVLFFHGPLDDPSSVDKKTSLRKHASTYALSGDPAKTGFVVLAVQGRSIFGGKRGAVFDTDYTGPDNVDVAAVDFFASELDKRGLVDKRRVYTIGASRGGHMAATYAMLRADKIAAFATIASDAPRASWSCPGPPTPGMVVYRSCDGFFSCESVERWLRAREAANADTKWLRLGEANDEEPSCEVKNKCTPKKADAAHHRWPKGRETDILAFLSRHALGAR